MGRLVLFLVISVDGYIARPDGELDFEIQDPEVGRTFAGALPKSADTIVLGRALFRGFEQAWPAMAASPESPPELVEFARWVETATKVVVSRNPLATSWTNSRSVVARGNDDVRARIAELKAGTDREIVSFGGVEFAQTLVRLDLVDEYRLKIQPVALGAGHALFDGLRVPRKLHLREARAYPSGVVTARYERG